MDKAITAGMKVTNKADIGTWTGTGRRQRRVVLIAERALVGEVVDVINGIASVRLDEESASKVGNPRKMFHVSKLEEVQ